MPILGEVHVDEDSVLHGWCWDSARPGLRLTVQIELDGSLFATLIASRFREDLRERGFGDGYHGFTAALTHQLARPQHPAVIQAREQQTGICFWQKRLGEFSIPADFSQTLAATRAQLAELGNAPALGRPAALAARLQSGFAACGARLRIPATGDHSLTFALPAAQSPRLSVLFDAGAEAAPLIDALRRAAGRLAALAAQFILSDAGDNAQTAAIAGQAKNLCYLRGPANHALRRNQAAALARGDLLVFLEHAQGRLAAALAALPSALILPPDVAGTTARIARIPAREVRQIDGPGLGLTLACPADLFRALGGFDPAMDDEAGLDVLDFALRAASAGASLAVWRRAAAIPATAQNLDAEHAFVSRWM